MINLKLDQDLWKVDAGIPRLESWVKLRRDDRKSLSDVSAIYALYHLGKLKYIGETAKLRSRMNQHSRNIDRNGIAFDEIRYLLIEGVQRVIIELMLISAYRPPGNMQLINSKPRNFNYYLPLIDPET